MARKRPTRDELADQVKRLEGKLRKLRETSGRSSPEADGLAESVVSSLGKLVPGLQKLIDVASQMPEFHERLAAIDEEVRRRFKEQPLRRASSEIAGGVGGRVMGIPPAVRRGRSRRETSTRSQPARPSGRHVVRGKHRQPRPPKVHISPETPEQLPVDVFDEDDHLVILAEAGALELKHITVSLEGTRLVISVEAPGRKGSQHVELPCDVIGKPRISLAKGILKVRVDKAPRPENGAAGNHKAGDS